MTSNDSNDDAVFHGSFGQAKKPWVTPSLEVISLESAEGHGSHVRTDSTGAQYQHNS